MGGDDGGAAASAVSTRAAHGKAAVADVKGREPVGLVADHRHALGLQHLQRARHIEDRLGAGADDGDGRTRKLRQIGRDVQAGLAAAVDAADAAGREDGDAGRRRAMTPVTDASAQQSDRGSATVHELRGGVLAHDVDGLWAAPRREDGVDFNAEVVLAKPAFMLLGGTVRPNAGVSVNNRGGTSKLYAGLLWEIAAANGVFLDLGLGAAIHDGARRTTDPTRKQLGTRVLFRIPVEVGFAVTERHRLSVLFAHISNGFLVDPNEGLGTLGIRYGYRF